MDVKRSRCLKCDGVVSPDGPPYCSDCTSSLKFLQKASPITMNQTKQDSTKTGRPVECGYVTQIVSSGVRQDNVFEAQMLLAPEVDLSSIKITVKGSNLRVNVLKPLNDSKIMNHRFPDIAEKSLLGDLLKRMMKHCENLLIPEGIDSGKVRAVVDSKNRIGSTSMEKLPQHCQENGVILKVKEYSNFETWMDGHKMSMNFIKIPGIYFEDDKEYYSAAILIEGLKVGTATLVNEDILNVKVHSSEDFTYVRNMNLRMPPKADVKDTSVEVIGNKILIRTPIQSD